MAQTMDLFITACDHKAYDGKATSVIIPLEDGQLGILPGHEETIYAVSIGELRYKTEDGKWHSIYVSGGMASTAFNRVRIMVMTAELPEEVEANKLEAEREKAEEEMRQKRSIEEYINTQLSLHRAIERMKAAQRHH